MDRLTASSSLLFVLSVFVSACAMLPPGNSIKTTPTLTLEKVESLQLGKAKQKDVQKIFGLPYQAIEIPSGNEIAWLYLNDKKTGQKASFNFSKNGTLTAKLWLVSEGEPEQDLNTALQRYKEAHFKKREAEWINPHAAPDEVYHEDNNLGISIEERKARREVWSITWFDPKARALADSKQKRYTKILKKNGLIGIVETSN